MNEAEAKQLIEEVDRALSRPGVTWRETTDDKLRSHGAQAFEGKGGDWRFVTVRFKSGAAAFGFDGFGYDGTATDLKTARIVHLTRELAAKAYGLATGGS